jgi:hydroxyacylglutathione hydrolase
MKKINVLGPKLLGKDFSVKKIVQANQIPKNPFYLDVREAKIYSQGHLRGALNIPFSPKLAYWAGWFVPYDRPVVVIADQNRGEPAVRELLLIGLDNIEGYMTAWEGESICSSLLSLEEFNRRKKEANPPLIVDVRTLGEYNAGHIEGAVHLPLSDLKERWKDLPKEREIVTMCQSGYRAQIGASYLQSLGYHAASLVGGAG